MPPTNNRCGLCRLKWYTPHRQSGNTVGKNLDYSQNSMFITSNLTRIIRSSNKFRASCIPVHGLHRYSRIFTSHKQDILYTAHNPVPSTECRWSPTRLNPVPGSKSTECKWVSTCTTGPLQEKRFIPTLFKPQPYKALALSSIHLAAFIPLPHPPPFFYFDSGKCKALSQV